MLAVTHNLLNTDANLSNNLKPTQLLLFSCCVGQDFIQAHMFTKTVTKMQLVFSLFLFTNNNT